MKRAALFLFFLLVAVYSYGQDMKFIDHDLTDLYKRISYLYERSRDPKDPLYINADTLIAANKIFSERLLHYTSTMPVTLAYDFPELQKAGVEIASSPDHQLRIYSWDTWLGGTMGYYGDLFQYKGDKVFAVIPPRSEHEIGSMYSAVWTIDVPQQKVYVARSGASFSNWDKYESISFFRIENNALNDSIKLIKVNDQLKNKYGVEFNSFSLKENESPLSLIAIDSRNATIKFRDVDSKLGLTDQYTTYRFNGHCFEKQGQ